MTNRLSEWELRDIANMYQRTPDQVRAAFIAAHDLRPDMTVLELRRMVLSAFSVRPRGTVPVDLSGPGTTREHWLSPIPHKAPTPPAPRQEIPTDLLAAVEALREQPIPERPPDAEPKFTATPLRERLKAKRAAEAAT